MRKNDFLEFIVEIAALQRLGFPHSGGINGSKHSHMRELRTQHGDDHW